MEKFFELVLDFSLEIIPLFLLAIFLAAALEEFVSTSIVERFIGKKDPGSVLVSTTAGALIPLCTCGMIPLAITLKRKKADWVPLMGFLTAGVASSIPALILTAVIAVSLPEVGYKIVVLRLVCALAFGFAVAYVAGLIFDKIIEEKSVEKKDPHQFCKIEECDLCEARQRHHLWAAPRWREVLDDFVVSIKEFAPWLIASIVVAAFISAVASRDIVTALLGNSSWWGPFVGGLIGLPFYLCAGADVPLVIALLSKGASLGTAIAIMVAVPTVNIPAAGLLKKWLGSRPTIIYLGTCWLIAGIVGVLVNVIF
ncbi:MAG: hypothetical protein C4562_00050 [Actinobacteria bacterium]|nr:MAG: hypothetical protein C4562_00050 [Actinomycetota bacterium]